MTNEVSFWGCLICMNIWMTAGLDRDPFWCSAMALSWLALALWNAWASRNLKEA